MSFLVICVVSRSRNLIRHMQAVASSNSPPGGGKRRAPIDCNPNVAGMPDVEIRRQAAGIHLLNLFGGPSREDGIDVFVRAWGAEMTVYDLEISEAHDLCDEGLWQTIRSDIEDRKYDGAGLSPPCGSSCANRGSDSGPRVLRDEWPQDFMVERT